jgi:hypothetical protein
MYVDESGDDGIQGSPTKNFILCGMVLHELIWQEFLNNLISFRHHLRDTKGLKTREEIHAAHFLTRPGELIRIPRHERVDILKHCIGWVSAQNVRIITVRVDKTKNNTSTPDIFEKAWQGLIQRFENTIYYKNFPAPKNSDERGMVISDNTYGLKLTRLFRKMRRYNPIPYKTSRTSRNLPIRYLVEDPLFKNSADSYIHQIVDVIAYFARQKYEPNVYMRKKGGHNWYDKLDAVLLKQACLSNPLGIVEI